MNIEQAKQIPLNLLIEGYGGRLSHQSKADEVWYYSPFRPDERTASLKVNPQRNSWYDFARGEGGSTIDLWLDYNSHDRQNREAVKTCLKELERFAKGHLFTNASLRQKTYSQQKTAAPKPERFRLIKPPCRIWEDSLKQEIGRRNLSLATVMPILQQAFIEDTKTGKRTNGFAFPNDVGGWEISIPNPYKNRNFKTSVGKKGITSIIGQNNDRALIFEGFWDYFTWVQINKQKDLKADVYVLNSVSFKRKTAETIIGRKQELNSVLLFMDNDSAGELALHDIALDLEPHGLIIGSMNHKYEGYKDLNECWMNCPAANRLTLFGANFVKVFYDSAWKQVSMGKLDNKLPL